MDKPKEQILCPALLFGLGPESYLWRHSGHGEYESKGQLWKDGFLRGRCLWISYYDGQVYWPEVADYRFFCYLDIVYQIGLYTRYMAWLFL